MLVEVKVLVSEDRVAEFHTMFGRWLADDQPAAPETAGSQDMGRFGVPRYGGV